MLKIFGAIYALGVLGAGLAQDPTTSTAPSQPLPGIVVTGTRDEVVRRYVDVLPEVNRYDQPLARFDRWVCPGVVNVSEQHAQAIADRISRTAIDIGLGVGQPGCSPNILVVFTDNGDNLAQELHAVIPQVFENIARTRRSGRTQMREFLESDRPVRWWHETTEATANADANLRHLGNRIGDRSQGISGSARTRGATLLSSAVRMDIGLALVVIDMSRIEAVELNALGDYVAFVALSQVDPSADMSGSDTVLNLFEQRSPRITGMSELDRAYLKALYDARGDVARASQQKSEIASRMLRAEMRAD